ncbi:MAG: hypothetical protein ABI210_07750, partial [Abditibacteriaceae bacterium]
MPKTPSFKSTFIPKKSPKDSPDSGSAKANRAARRLALQEAYAAEHPESAASVTHSVASLKAALREGTVAGITKDNAEIPVKATTRKVSISRPAREDVSENSPPIETPEKPKPTRETTSKPAARTTRTAAPSTPTSGKPTSGKPTRERSAERPSSEKPRRKSAAEKPKRKREFASEEGLSGAPPPESPIEEVKGFESLELPEPIMQAVRDLGFESMTPIQAQAIPLLLKGHDLIGQAQT